MTARVTLTLALLALACDDGADDAPSGVVDDPGPPVDIFDPLSMPEQPTWHVDAFRSADTCETCHPTHTAEWRGSMHAYAMRDPVFQALVRLRQQDYDGAQDPFCTQCHTQIGTRGGEITPNFSFDDLSPVTMEGVTCEGCHKVQRVDRPFNSGHVIAADAALCSTIPDPVPNDFHASERCDVQAEPVFCGGCHDVIEVSGLNLERPYEEWLTSPAREAGVTCQDCHMPSYQGQAAVDGPERTLHRHTWLGAALPIGDGFLDPAALDARVAAVGELLGGSADLTLDAPIAVAPGDQLDVVVTVVNLIPAHNFPTGTTFNRQVWVELVATDSDGQVLYETGTLDDQGDLRNFWSELDPFGDDDLLVLSSVLTDAFGDPVIPSWRATEHTSAAIPPLYDRTWTLFVPTAAAAPGPITIRSRLLFRQYGPYVLRTLGLEEHVDDLRVFEIDREELVVDLGAP